MTGSFSAVGFSGIERVRAGQSITATLAAGAGETFDGVVALARSQDGLNGWAVVDTWDGTSVAIDENEAARTITNETGQAMFYRLECTDAGAADALDYALAQVYDIVEVLVRNAAGQPVISQAANGDVIIHPPVVAPGGVT